LEDRTVPAALGHGLEHVLNSANPADLTKLLIDVQGIINRQLPVAQFATLSSDAKTLAAAVPTAAKTDANKLVTEIQTASTDGQITRQEKFDIDAAAQKVFNDLRGTGTPKSVTQALRQDLKALDQAFAPTAADRTFVRTDIKTILQDSLSHFHSDWN
jgi:hypothetical protein